MRDLPVLAVDAVEVAVGEEDVADAFGAGDGGFLAVVDADGGDFGFASGMAEAEGMGAVDAALAGAEGAGHGRL